MPKIGEIGYRKHNRCILHACIDCGKERWVMLRKGRPVNLRCNSCGAKNRVKRLGTHNANWKGGRTKDSRGYILIKLQPDDFFYPMTQIRGYVFEHRLVVAKALGRCLHLWEIVHHGHNCAKDDNRIENLQLVTDDRHKQITVLERKIDFQAQRITVLEAEMTLLKKPLGVSNEFARK